MNTRRQKIDPNPFNLLRQRMKRKRKQAEENLRIAATAFESQEGIMVTDANSMILRVNHAFTRITGYTPEEVIGKTPRILSSGRQDANFYAAMRASIDNTGAWEGEIWNRRKNGEIYPEFVAITAVKDPNGIVTNYVGTFSDITKSKAAAEEVHHLAFYDPLTRLPNRRLLMDRLKQALASSARSNRQGSLLFIDLDNFKTINDTLILSINVSAKQFRQSDFVAQVQAVVQLHAIIELSIIEDNTEKSRVRQ